MAEKIIFADCEGNDFLEGLDKMWMIQIAEDVDETPTVYADREGFPPISDALKILKECDKVVFHFGMNYDYWAINKLYPNTLKKEQIIDSVVISRLMNASAKRHNLADLGEQVGVPKGEFNDFSKWDDKMVQYGIDDVRIIQALWKGDRKRGVPSFGQFYEDYKQACDMEFYVAYVIAKQTMHGFRFDVEAAQELELTLRTEQQEINEKLQEAFPPITHKRISEKTGKRLKDKIEVFNAGSRQQIANRLINKYGWKPKKKTPSGQAQVDEGILDALEYPEAKLMAQYMKLNKKLGQLVEGDNAWLKMVKENELGIPYIHGQVNTIGCRTQRMTHFKPNVAQADSDPRMRGLWLPDPDHLQVGVDAEGLELRELAHFLEPYDGGSYIKIVHEGKKEDGTDIHSQNRIAASLYLRDSAKTMIYAHNYGCGDGKLGEVIRNDAKAAGKPIPEGSLTKLGKELRANIEVGIVGLGDLISKCKKSHNKFGSLPSHDGRRIQSNYAHSALNTLLQGNGSVVMKQALVEFDKEMERLQLLDKFGYCANVHDEFQLSVHPDFAEKVAEVGQWSITRAGEVLDVRCPLVGSADIGKNWSETH